MPKEELDEAGLAAWRNFITAHANLVDLIDRELTAADLLPLHWYDVLIELVEAPENRLRMHELAQKVVLSRSGLTRLVDKLETAGLLRRETAPDDRRGAFAVLTNKGKDAVRKSWPVYSKGIAKYFASRLTKGEAQIIRDVFARILETTQKDNS
jgi:DNA-binding MarR family transcriptional regulator